MKRFRASSWVAAWLYLGAAVAVAVPLAWLVVWLAGVR